MARPQVLPSLRFRRPMSSQLSYETHGTALRPYNAHRRQPEQVVVSVVIRRPVETVGNLANERGGWLCNRACRLTPVEGHDQDFIRTNPEDRRQTSADESARSQSYQGFAKTSV